MDELQSLRYAQSRLALAKMMSDSLEATKWAEHVAYFKAQITSKCDDNMLQFDIWVSQGLKRSDFS